MKLLSSRITEANKLLSRYAVPHGKGLGRVYAELPDATRFPFQRDRDRIIHTQAFRRLKHKTQVFASGLRLGFGRQFGHDDHYRTRITHTLEVAQLSRDIARTLGLNEDLAEAIALAHDLGHTPFGHAGEAAMNECMQKYGASFEHNYQSLRVVRLLENRSELYPGLNLSGEILEGLIKHQPSPSPLRPAVVRSDWTMAGKQGFEGLAGRSPSLEAQVVNFSDEIAYTAHDTDDGLRAGQFGREDIESTVLGKTASIRAKSAGSELRGAIIDLLVSDLYEETERRLKKYKIHSLGDVHAAKSELIGFSVSTVRMVGELRKFLWDRLYKSPSVLRQASRGKRIITALFSVYIKSPPAKVKALQKKTGAALEEAVKDYIAGMTDPFAIAAMKKE